jgi:hypothetical protein
MGRTFTLYPAGGRAPRLLNDRANGLRVLKGIEGLNAPDFQLVTSTTPLLDGEQLDDVYALSRDIFLPMMISGRTEGEFRERAAALISDLFPLRGQGMFEVAQPDGKRRRVPVIYVDGMRGTEGITDGGQTWWKFGLKLRALNPWWLGDTITQRWAQEAEPVTFLPITPRRVNPSAVLGQATINNPGDVETYPIWRLTAPATGVTLTRPDTGEYLGIAASMPAGSTLTINTNPRAVDLRLSSGVAWWRYLTNGSSLWQIPADTVDEDGRRRGSPLSLEVTGGGPGTVLELEYTPRYATCL